MKARAVYTDTAVQTSKMVTSRIHGNRHSTQYGMESIADLQVRIQVRREEKARLARVEQIKSQVDAGTYALNSRAIVNGLTHSPLDWNFLCMEDMAAIEATPE